jgi:hypothetical protein
MKKFSKITNQKIGEMPIKEVKKPSNEDIFKIEVLSLLEKFLCVRTHGPIDRYSRAGNIDIVGKEHFVEALINLLSEKTLKDQSKLLEGLKSELKDWSIIDRKIEEFSKKIENIPSNKLINQQKKILSIYENYKDDEELLLIQINKYSNKLTSYESALERANVAEQIAKSNDCSKEIFEKIANIYYKKSEELKG